MTEKLHTTPASELDQIEKSDVIHISDPNGQIEDLPLSEEELAAAEKRLEELLVETEIEVFAAGLKVGEHEKGHLSLNIMPILRRETLSMVVDFYARSGCPKIPPGTEFRLNLVVAEAFLLAPGDKERPGLQVVEQLREGEGLPDAYNRGFDTLDALAIGVEETLVAGRKYKATLHVAWMWPKKTAKA